VQAVILAGGLGSRLMPLTLETPKPMVKAQGEPFLAHLLRLFVGQGISEVVLCTGYLGAQIEEYFGTGKDIGLNIHYSRETWLLLGTGGALKQAEGMLKSCFFLINGDTYVPLDFRQLMHAFYYRCKKSMMMVYRDTDGLTGVKKDVALNKDHLVTAYMKGQDNPRLEFINTGVLVLEREVISGIEAGRRVSLESEVFPTLIEQGQMTAYETDQRFFDIGTITGFISLKNI
jgi:NDP-sugar pyrophosphorylase family protein